MERRVIDMEKDPRREQFQLFSGYSFPYAGVTVQLDVTALELRLRAEHKPIFLTMLYVICLLYTSAWGSGRTRIWSPQRSSFSPPPQSSSS